MDKAILEWRNKGYTEDYLFDDYILLVNPSTLNRVRIYKNGQIWTWTMGNPDYALTDSWKEN